MKHFIKLIALTFCLYTHAAIGVFETPLARQLKTNTTIVGLQQDSGLLTPTGPWMATGDSITASASIYWPTLTNLLKTTAATNWAVAGTQIADLGQIGGVFSNYVTTNLSSWILTGYNDMRFAGASALGQAMYSNTLAAASVWLTIPRANILNGQSSSISYSGSWSTDPVYPIVAGKYTSANGATATATLYGTTVYLCSMGASSAGGATASFTVTIDGVSRGSFNPYSVYLTTGNGQTYAPYLCRFAGLSDGPHLVVMTVASTGNDVHLFWMASNAGAAVTDGPNLFVSNCLNMTGSGYTLGAPYNTGSDAIVRQFNGIIASICGQLSGDGLNVFYVPNVSYNPNIDVSGDGVHPTSSGGNKIAADLFEAMKWRSSSRSRGLVQKFSTFNKVNLASGPTITGGAGVPTTTEPDGSIFLRSDGGLYVRQAGAWVAK